MTLVSIFCSLVDRLPAARELKIRARPVGFPGTLLAMLRYDDDGDDAGDDKIDDSVYINVYGHGRLLSADKLRDMLRSMGQPVSNEFLKPASAREMVRHLSLLSRASSSVRASE